MPDSPTIRGGPSETGANAAASTGIALTAHASAHTKATTWTELIASTDYEASWLLVQVGYANVNRYMVDIGVGASTAEVALIPNITCVVSSDLAVMPYHALFPIRVPRGTRISARMQGSTGGTTCSVSVVAIASPITAPPSPSSVETVGAITASTDGTLLADPGGVAHTDGAWTEITASTAQNWSWVAVDVGNGGDLAWGTRIDSLVDIGVGGAGAEVVVVSDLWNIGSTLNDCYVFNGVALPVSIPRGSRVSMRHRTSSIVAAERRMRCVLHGVG